jgi:hypothetical protein
MAHVVSWGWMSDGVQRGGFDDQRAEFSAIEAFGESRLPPPSLVDAAGARPESPHVDSTPVGISRGMSDGVTITESEARRTNRRLLLAGAGAAVAGLVGLMILVTSSDGPDTMAGTGDTTTTTSVDVGRTTVPVGKSPSTTRNELNQPITSSSATTTTTAPTTTVAPLETAPPLNEVPAVVARPVPVDPPPPPPSAPPPPWAASVFTTAGGHISTDVGCAADLSAASLDAFVAGRVGPVLGWDYQHVYPLGGNRYLWLFQDTFIDQSGTATTLDKASFVHNSAMIQEGTCFRVLHGGSTTRPAPFEPGTGTKTLTTWFWPMGGEVHNGKLYVFWAEMLKDNPDPQPPDGLGWHPVTTHIATYDPSTLARLDFRRAPDSGASPIYGYAVQSDATHTYLFANTFEQNLTREGGWFNGPHSGTKMFLARVPRGRLFDKPEYWTSQGWISEVVYPEPFLQRHWSEFPMQPRLIDGQWVATTAVNGYWGEEFEVDVANNAWGPWTTIASTALIPRGADPKMNTYHAHLLPWRDGFGQLVVSVSNNARDMLRDAWPNPARYRPMIFTSPWQQAPPPPTTPPATTTTVPETTTTTLPPTTTEPPPTTTTTTVPPTTTTEPPPTSIAAPTTLGVGAI